MRTRGGKRKIHAGGAPRKKYDRASLLPNVILQLIPYLGAQELRAIRAAAIFFRDTVDGYIAPLAGRRREALESACPAGTPDIFLYTIQKTARLSIRVLESPAAWAALQTLHFRSNQLAALPESFGHLAALQTLDLGSNQLTALPESFGRLAALRELNLNSNQLIALPESIGHLTALQTLDLGSNQLIALPESIGRLAALRELYLYDNQLTELPESFGHLAALRMLYLYDNRLTVLPESFGQLTLSDLHLHGMRVGVDAHCADLLARLGISNTFYYLHPLTT